MRETGSGFQRKERSQEEAGFLLALEGSGGTGVPMLGGVGPSPRAGGSKISLFRCSRGFAGITSSHPCYSSLEPLSLCPKVKARPVPKGEVPQKNRDARQKQLLQPLNCFCVRENRRLNPPYGRLQSNCRKCKVYNLFCPRVCKIDIFTMGSCYKLARTD